MTKNMKNINSLPRPKKNCSKLNPSEAGASHNLKVYKKNLPVRLVGGFFVIMQIYEMAPIIKRKFVACL